jgi:hypothetical protein
MKALESHTQRIENEMHLIQMQYSTPLSKISAILDLNFTRNYRWGHWIFQLTESFQPHYGHGVD